MQNIIVFISPKISPFLHNRIVDTLQSYPMIQITENIDEATIIIEKRENIDNIKQMMDDILTELKTRPFELHTYSPEKTIKLKYFVPKNIDIKRFNKIKQNHKMMFSTTRRR